MFCLRGWVVWRSWKGLVWKPASVRKKFKHNLLFIGRMLNLRDLLSLRTGNFILNDNLFRSFGLWGEPTSAGRDSSFKCLLDVLIIARSLMTEGTIKRGTVDVGFLRVDVFLILLQVLHQDVTASLLQRGRVRVFYCKSESIGLLSFFHV